MRRAACGTAAIHVDHAHDMVARPERMLAEIFRAQQALLLQRPEDEGDASAAAGLSWANFSASSSTMETPMPLSTAPL